MTIDRKRFGIYTYIIFLITATIMWFSYTKIDLTMEYFVKDIITSTNNISRIIYENSSIKYLVYDVNCKIPDLNPFNDEVKPYIKMNSYYPCTASKLLTYTTKENNETVLRIDNSAIKYYSKKDVSCCISEIRRGHDDSDVSLSKCQDFKDSIILETFVLVKCYQKKPHKEVYRNVHSVINPKEVRNKLEDTKTNAAVKPLSVLIICVDSVSRINSFRAMPRTRQFLEHGEWIEMKGYNKVGENTFPNFMALLTGVGESQIYKFCNPTVQGNLDRCSLLWYEYRKLGYVTAYAEDECKTSTFNYRKKGFTHPPTDYYFRPYMLAAEKYLKIVKKDGMTYCTGPETSGERILNIIKDFTSTFQNHPYFGLFWMNTFSHNDLNSVSRMDSKLVKFLDSISNTTSDNTITIFLSDHGMRFGNIRYTTIGWYEDKLPFFFIRLPRWFQKKFPEEYKYIRLNTNHLVTPFDVYMTLQDVLSISAENFKTRLSKSCPKCSSLFRPIQEDRSCEDAGIPRSWCTCKRISEMQTNSTLAKSAGNYAVNVIEDWKKNISGNANKCAKFKLDKVIAGLTFEKEDYIFIYIKTYPEAFFEALIKVNGDETNPKFKTSISEILRIDFYGKQKCVEELSVKKYCYCKDQH